MTTQSNLEKTIKASGNHVDTLIPGSVTNYIVKEYKQLLSKWCMDELRRLNGGVWDGDIVTARRTAILDFMQFIEDSQWTKPYYLPAVRLQASKSNTSEVNK